MAFLISVLRTAWLRHYRRVGPVYARRDMSGLVPPTVIPWQVILIKILVSLLATRVGWGLVMPLITQLATGRARMGLMGKAEGIIVTSTMALLLSLLALKRVTYSRSRWADEFITGATEAWMSGATDGAPGTPITGRSNRAEEEGDPTKMHFGDFSPDVAALAAAGGGVADTAEGREIVGTHVRAMLDVEERMRRVESSLSARGSEVSSSATSQRSLTSFQREWLYAAKLEFPICKINVAQRATVASFLRSKIKLAHPDMRQTDLWMHVSRITTAYFIPTAEEILQAQVLQDREVGDRVELAALPEA